MSKKLSFDEFADNWRESNSHMCRCHVTSFPPCGFCEGHYLDDVKLDYEDYLEEFEEEK